MGDMSGAGAGGEVWVEDKALAGAGDRYAKDGDAG